MTGLRDYIATLGVAAIGGGIGIIVLSHLAHHAASVLP